jgi:imidazolonepropionase-like amidohydrolase
MTRTAFTGATLLDGTGAAPVHDAAVVVANGRIEWVGANADLGRDGLELVDVSGKWVIPGLIDANVHLNLQSDPEFLLRYEPGEYDELVLEGAQIALKAGVTTVFDTWGPLEALRRTRDRITAGEAVGARMFIAGNIIGNDGPWSVDFDGRVFGQMLNPEIVAAVNAHWEVGVGGDLPWMSAEGVRERVREYIATSGIDFVKYSSSVHKDLKFICFSPDAQRAIVDEAHSAGMTAQACTISPEALKLAIEAGTDLLQHGNLTGRFPMPQETVDLICSRQLPCVAFLMTRRYMEAAGASRAGARIGDLFGSQLTNNRALIDGGAKLMFGDDAAPWSPSVAGSLAWGKYYVDDFYMDLGRSHVYWFRAASEQGMDPMAALVAATRNVAEGYGKLEELGTIEPGKHADFVVLDADPLADPENYARVAHVIKDGEIVDRDSLPEKPVLTAETDDEVWRPLSEVAVGASYPASCCCFFRGTGASA